MFNKNIIRKLIDHRNYVRSPKELEELKNQAIKMAHIYHYEHNRFYNKLCKARGIDREISPDDFHRIIYPHTVFKTYDIQDPELKPEDFKRWVENISTIRFDFKIRKSTSFKEFLDQLYENKILIGFSRGTTGNVSIIPRDRYTQIMMIKSYTETFETIFGHNMWTSYKIFGMGHTSYLQIIWTLNQVLEGIPREEINIENDYIKSGFISSIKKEKTIYEKILHSFLNVEKLNIHRVSNRILNKLRTYNRIKVIIIGSPILIKSMAENIIENNIKLRISKDSVFIVLQAVRDFKDAQTYKDIYENAFGITINKPLNTYAMAELNSLFIEDVKCRHMHIPPWIMPVLFDKNYEYIEPEGKVSGFFAFLEPSNTSYPGFILTDDYVTINYDTINDCEIKTPIIEKIEAKKDIRKSDCVGILGNIEGKHK